MKYFSGEDIKLGDKVKLWEGNLGVVVCSVDDSEYCSEYPKKDWESLKEGVLIKSDKAGLVHQIEVSEDMELLSRCSRKT